MALIILIEFSLFKNINLIMFVFESKHTMFNNVSPRTSGF